MDRSKGLVVILSHADTEDKIEILIESINSIKKQNYDILISSHINIPDYINDMVDYFIYDKENELIMYDDYTYKPNVVFVWMKLLGYEQNYPIKFNHAYAVLELIKNASFFAESKGYENVHFINYDYVINDENLLLEHNRLLTENEIISYDFVNYGAPNSEHISSALFSVKNNNFLNLIRNIKTKDDYCNYGSPIFENFLYDYITKYSDMRIFKLPASILFDNLPPDEIKKSTTNKIAVKSVMDDHIIDNSGKTIYLFLTKDESENHYILIRCDNEILSVNFKIGSSEYNYNSNYGINLLPIRIEQLEKNILIKINNLEGDLKINRKLTSETVPAHCTITEKSYIKDIFKDDYSINKKYTIEKYSDDNATKRYDLINFLINEYDFKDYLEIGVNDGSCIRKINIENKDGVDPSPNSELGFGEPVPEINYQVTSDYFFDNYAYKKYDIIFIDGLHHSDQVDKDIQNSLRYLNDGGFILVHDCNPPEYEMQLVPRQKGIWSGDVWKSIVKLRCTNPNLEINVIDADWGVGVIRRSNSDIYTKDTIDKCLEWNYFDSNREILLNIISVDDFLKTFKKENKDIFKSIKKENKDIFKSIKKDKDFYNISMKNQTDKVYYHGYHYFYPNYFDEFRYDEFKMLEIGYGDGASMRSWVEYFPKADITVMDINFEFEYSNRCRVFRGDQSNEDDLNMIINNVKSAKLIIDDGSHNPLHQLNTFYHLFRYLLEPGGVYIIEDIELSYWNPDSSLYGFKSGDINIINSLLKCNEMVNHEFSGVKNTLDISTITYAQNCIIITKRDAEESNYFNRDYRFKECINY